MNLGIGALTCLVVGFAIMLLTTHHEKRQQEEARSNGRRHPVRMWPLLVGFVFVLAGLGMGAGWSGQQDQERIDAECAKHGMDGFRVAFGHSGCLTKDGQVRYFEDVQ